MNPFAARNREKFVQDEVAGASPEYTNENNNNRQSDSDTALKLN